jgi:hypothetical protein
VAGSGARHEFDFFLHGCSTSDFFAASAEFFQNDINAALVDDP